MGVGGEAGGDFLAEEAAGAEDGDVHGCVPGLVGGEDYPWGRWRANLVWCE